MSKFSSPLNRRRFLVSAAAASSGLVFASGMNNPEARAQGSGGPSSLSREDGSPADYTLRIATGPVETAPKRIISATTYNGQFPGPLLRLKEGKPVTVEIHNETDTPEQLHWHGQMVPGEVDGSSEEGTPFIPAHGSRRIT